MGKHSLEPDRRPIPLPPPGMGVLRDRVSPTRRRLAWTAVALAVAVALVLLLRHGAAAARPAALLAAGIALPGLWWLRHRRRERRAAIDPDAPAAVLDRRWRFIIPISGALVIAGGALAVSLPDPGAGDAVPAPATRAPAEDPADRTPRGTTGATTEETTEESTVPEEPAPVDGPVEEEAPPPPEPQPAPPPPPGPPPPPPGGNPPPPAIPGVPPLPGWVPGIGDVPIPGVGG